MWNCLEPKLISGGFETNKVKNLLNVHLTHGYIIQQ